MNSLRPSTFGPSGISTLTHAQHSRHPPPHQVGQEHGPDHQGHADGRLVEDAAGAAGRDQLPALRRHGRRVMDHLAAGTATTGIRSWRSARSAQARGHHYQHGQGPVRRRSTPTSSARPPSSTPPPRSSSPSARKPPNSSRAPRRKLVAEFTYHDPPTFGEAQAISKFAQSLFLKGEADAMDVLYTRFINTLSQRPDKRRPAAARLGGEPAGRSAGPGQGGRGPGRAPAH